MIRAFRMASRNSGSSAASIVIWVKKTISFGSSARRSISSNRSARMAFNVASFVSFFCRWASSMSFSDTG